MKAVHVPPSPAGCRCRWKSRAPPVRRGRSARSPLAAEYGWPPPQKNDPPVAKLDQLPRGLRNGRPFVGYRASQRQSGQATENREHRHLLFDKPLQQRTSPGGHDPGIRVGAPEMGDDRRHVHPVVGNEPRREKGCMPRPDQLVFENDHIVRLPVGRRRHQDRHPQQRSPGRLDLLPFDPPWPPRAPRPAGLPARAARGQPAPSGADPSSAATSWRPGISAVQRPRHSSARRCAATCSVTLGNLDFAMVARWMKNSQVVKETSAGQVANLGQLGRKKFPTLTDSSDFTNIQSLKNLALKLSWNETPPTLPIKTPFNMTKYLKNCFYFAPLVFALPATAETFAIDDFSSLNLTGGSGDWIGNWTNAVSGGTISTSAATGALVATRAGTGAGNVGSVSRQFTANTSIF